MDQQANENNKLGVRKGAWTREEDELLRLCMKTHGEGMWHQVPPKAGLNRCRKSCRLRWLNYLKPNIKRGVFMQDEIDLILKLHKLLGNRWSLIAGRLPGRTGNDIKNYWNTRLRVCSQMNKAKEESGFSPETRKITIIRPKPRMLSKTSCFPNNKATLFEPYRFAGQTLSPVPAENHQIDWWRNYLLDDVDSGTSGDSCSLGLTDELFTNHWVEEMAKSTRTCLDQGEPDNIDFWFNVEQWNRSIEEQRTI